LARFDQYNVFKKEKNLFNVVKIIPILIFGQRIIDDGRKTRFWGRLLDMA
jgi:hypothetical protein